MKIRLIVAVMIITATVFLSVAGCATDPPSPAQTVTGGLPAPGRLATNFVLQSLDGETVSLESFRGKPVLLNFWASWCGPCREEMPYLEDFYRDPDWQDRDVVLLAVNIQESAGLVRDFVETFGLTFPVLLDSTGDTARAYNISGIPTTFVIDENGIIKEIKIGSFASTDDIERLLNKYFS